MARLKASGVEPGQRQLNGPQTTGRQYRNLSPVLYGTTREDNAPVPMRDGTRLLADIHRPQADGRFPALIAAAPYPRQLQDLGAPAAFIEAGTSDFWVPRGYAHVIANLRGTVGSDGTYTFFDEQERKDLFDLVEWVAGQPWCDGKVGMVGISGFGAEQLAVAKKQPPHLRAIFPFDSRGAYGEFGGFRDEYPGGVIHLFRYLVGHFSALHQNKGAPGPLPAEREKLWRDAMGNPDYKMYPHVYNVIAQKGQHMPPYYNVLVDPYDSEAAVQKSEAEFNDIRVPTYTGSGWYGYTYKTHLNGCQHWFRNIKAPKKLLLAGPAHLERPYHGFHNEVLRWHDFWLKGMNTGIMDEPAVRY